MPRMGGGCHGRIEPWTTGQEEGIGSVGVGYMESAMIIVRCVTVIVVMMAGYRMEELFITRNIFQSELCTLEILALLWITRREGSVLACYTVREILG